MIPQDTVQQIIQTANVVDVVSDFVSLKKRGANMIACCPFHNEKTPSFSVSATKQIYKCFGCGKGGDSVRFLMDLEGLSYPEALRWLAKKYGIEIQEKEYTDEELLAQNERESLFIVLEFAQKYFAQQLISEEGKSIGYAYFKERGYNNSTIEKFGLGYSLDKWDSLTKHALKSGFSISILEKAGLSILREGKGPIDRFRGRVIFPINNVAGKPIAFGARILKVNPKSPKYLNSPETDIYHKSRIVYGIYTAKNSIRQEDNCYLVEGYTDVVSLNQAGIENVVASSGTSLTKEQIQLIRRFSPNITMLYDGDSAGLNASLRGTDLILEEGMNVRVLTFPEGEDPDSFVKKVGTEGFRSFIEENKKDFIRFKTELSLKEIGDDPIAKAGLISDLVSTINKVPDGIKRAVFFKEVSLLLQIDEAVLINEGNKLLRKKTNAYKKLPNQNYDPNLPPADFFLGPLPTELPPDLQGEELIQIIPEVLFEEEFLKMLISFGHEIVDRDEENGVDISYARYTLAEIRKLNFTLDLHKRILSHYKEEFNQGRIPNTTFFTSHQDEEIQKKVIDWLSSKNEISPNWEKSEIAVPSISDKLDELGFKNVLRLKKAKLELEYIESSSHLNDDLNEEEERQIFDKLNKIKKKIRRFSDLLGSVI